MMSNPRKSVGQGCLTIHVIQTNKKH